MRGIISYKGVNGIAHILICLEESTRTMVSVYQRLGGAMNIRTQPISSLLMKFSSAYSPAEYASQPHACFPGGLVYITNTTTEDANMIFT